MVQDIFGPILGVFVGNSSSKQRLIKLKFWPQVVFIFVQIPFKAFWRTEIFTVTGLPKFWIFGPILTPIWSLNQAI